MGLADDLAAIPEKPRSIADEIGDLPEEDQRAVREACANPRIPSPAILAVLAEHGVVLGDSAFNKWRSGLR